MTRIAGEARILEKAKEIGVKIGTKYDAGHEERYDFYLANHDFEVYVNKACQSYKKPLHEILDDQIVIEYYRSLQKGGCNESKCEN